MALRHSPKIPSDGIVLLYDVTNPKTFDSELSDTGTIFDRTGNGNDAISTNVGRDYYDRCLNLKRTNPTKNGYLTVPNNDSLNSETITLSCWFNAASFNDGNTDPSYLFSKMSGSGGSATGYAVIIFEQGGTKSINVKTNNGSSLPGAADSILALNTWTHIAVTIGTTLIRLYLNGNFVGSVSSPALPLSSNTQDLTIGKYNLGSFGEGYFDAAINNIVLYNRELSQSEISQLYNAQINKNRRPPDYLSDDYPWIPRQIQFPSGTTSWVVPPNITSVSAVCVGGGGGGAGSQATASGGGAGGGGGFAYGNIPVTAGQVLTVFVGNGGAGGPGGLFSGPQSHGNPGQQSYISRSGQSLLLGGGGGAGLNFGNGGSGGSSSGLFRTNGGTGGSGGQAASWGRAGGGGAGGYSGNGGNGAQGGGLCSQPSHSNQGGSGGAGGGGGRGASSSTGQSGGVTGGGGGGVGLLGEGSSGNAGSCSTGTSRYGKGGSGGNDANQNGGYHGGGGGGGTTYSNDDGGNGNAGGVRFIIGGKGRYYPSTNTEFDV